MSNFEPSIDAARAKRSKYGVAPKEQRVYRGVLYASKAERMYAQTLDLRTDTDWWLRQVPVQLGEDVVYRVDFLVSEKTRAWDSPGSGIVHAVDVKGAETREFKRVKKLWAKYGPFPLRIVKRGKAVEVIEAQ